MAPKQKNKSKKDAPSKGKTSPQGVSTQADDSISQSVQSVESSALAGSGGLQTPVETTSSSQTSYSASKTLDSMGHEMKSPPPPRPEGKSLPPQRANSIRETSSSAGRDDSVEGTGQVKSKSNQCATKSCSKYLNKHDTHVLCYRCLGAHHMEVVCEACRLLSSTNRKKRRLACQYFLDHGHWQDHPFSRPFRSASVPSGKLTEKSLSSVLPKPAPVDPLAQKLTRSEFSQWAPNPPNFESIDPFTYYIAEHKAFEYRFGHKVTSDEDYANAFLFVLRCYIRMFKQGRFNTLGASLETIFDKIETTPGLTDKYFPPPEPEDESEDDRSLTESEKFAEDELFGTQYEDNTDEVIEDDPEEEIPIPTGPPSRKRSANTPLDSNPKRTRMDILEDRMESMETSMAARLDLILSSMDRDRKAPLESTPVRPTLNPRFRERIFSQSTSQLTTSDEDLVANSSADEIDLSRDDFSIVSNPNPILTSEEKKGREDKIKWLTTALPLCNLRPVPSDVREKDCYGVFKEKVRRDTVPIHPDVCSKVQEFVNQHFDIVKKGKQNKTLKKIQNFCEAPKAQNTLFRSPAAVPGAIIDYLDIPVRDALANPAADATGRLPAGSNLGKSEKEALLLEERAKLNIQLNNSLSVNLFALSAIVEQQSALLTNFLSDPPPLPNDVEDFPQWRQTVTNLVSLVSDKAALLSSGLVDSLYVARDHLKLHTQDLITAHTQRRSAWLSYSQASEGACKELNGHPFEVFSPADTEPVPLLGKVGEARMLKFMDIRAKSVPMVQLASASTPQYKQRSKQRQRQQKPFTQVSALSPVPPNPDTQFKANQGWKSNQSFRNKQGNKGKAPFKKQAFKKPQNPKFQSKKQ